MRVWCHGQGRGLGEPVSDILTKPGQRLRLLVADRIEELLTMPSRRKLRGGATSVRGGERARGWGRFGALASVAVGLFDGEELAEAGAGSVSRAGRPLPPDAVALLVRATEGLPLLQLTLKKLRRALDDTLARPRADLLGELDELGGVGGPCA